MNVEFSAFIDSYCFLQKLDFEGQNDQMVEWNNINIMFILCVSISSSG